MTKKGNRITSKPYEGRSVLAWMPAGQEAAGASSVVMSALVPNCDMDLNLNADGRRNSLRA